MYCLKSLSCESGKTFSCSNTSKNAVQYITIRTISFVLSGEPILRSSLPVPTAEFFSGKWCKDKCYFLNHQNFSKKFFRKFSEPFCLSLLIEAGAKVSLFSESPKLFRTFFKIFQNLYSSLPRCVSLSKRVQR